MDKNTDFAALVEKMPDYAEELLQLAENKKATRINKTSLLTAWAASEPKIIPRCIFNRLYGHFDNASPCEILRNFAKVKRHAESLGYYCGLSLCLNSGYLDEENEDGVLILESNFASIKPAGVSRIIAMLEDELEAIMLECQNILNIRELAELTAFQGIDNAILLFKLSVDDDLIAASPEDYKVELSEEFLTAHDGELDAEAEECLEEVAGKTASKKKKKGKK